MAIVILKTLATTASLVDLTNLMTSRHLYKSRLTSGSLCLTFLGHHRQSSAYLKPSFPSQETTALW